MFTKMYQFDNVPPIFPILQKVLLRLSEQGDVTETQRITFVPPKFFSKLGPCLVPWSCMQCSFEKSYQKKRTRYRHYTYT